MLDAELTWGIRHPSVQTGAVAQYGMVNGYLQNKDCTHGWINTVHKISYVSNSEEQFEELKSFLNGGFIADCKTVFRHAWELEEYSDEPLLVADLGKYRFWAQRKYSTVLVTWTMTNEILDFERAIALKQKVKAICLHDLISPCLNRMKDMEARAEARAYDYDY